MSDALMIQNLKPWFSTMGGRYPGKEPYFYDTADFPWVRRLEEEWEGIWTEMQSFLQERPRAMKPYFFQKLTFPPGQWKTTGFLFWGIRSKANIRRCPKLMALLKTLPDVTTCSLNLLEPGTNINWHQGETDAVVRGHLALSIPEGLPDCGFQVGTEIRGWQPGKVFLFADIHSHTAWNNTDKRRIVLLFDVLRPEFRSQREAICSNVLIKMFLQRFYLSNPLFRWLPGWVHDALHFKFRCLLRILIPFGKWFGVYIK